MADLSTTPWSGFPATAAPGDKVSRNFQLFELTKSELAERRGIANGFPAAAELRNAVYLCREVMQPVREKFGRFAPNSVFRSQPLERALKNKPASWTSPSQHTRGQACDIEVPGRTNLQLARWVQETLEFDQLILECYSADEGPNSGWVHVSLRAPGQGANRRQVLSYVKNPRTRRYEYVDGLVESP